MSHELGDLSPTTKEPITSRGNWRGIADASTGISGSAAWPPQEQPRIYVCGPAAFVEAATSAPGRKRPATNTIRTERFGPTAG